MSVELPPCREASVIQVELNARRVGRVKPLRDGHDVGICGDAGLAAKDLLRRLRYTGNRL